MTQSRIESLLQNQLRLIEQQGLYRCRHNLGSAQGVEVVYDNERLINFSSNDYLGLANHPSVVSALKSAVNKWGVGSGSAHLICGHSTPHHILEEELAEFTGCDRALLFSTGYMANLGVISSLVGNGDRILEDRLNHASLLDGGMLSRAKLQRFRHADTENLQQSLRIGQFRQQLIVSDGVFSMDGDLAPLPELVKISKESNALLMIDDAHGFGVLGDRGRGIIEHFCLQPAEINALVGTLGKAFGTFGAFVAGTESLIESLIQGARSYIYTTALPPAIAVATRVSLQLIQSETWRRDKLRALICRFRKGSRQLGLNVKDSDTPIQPIIIGDNELTLRIADELKSQGFLISAVRPPTVPAGTARLRITLSSSHEEHHIDLLLDALDKILNGRHG